VSDWERFGDWIATLAVASLAWVSGLVAPDVPAGLPASASASAPVENQLSSMMSWAQQEEEPPIEQVGEDTAEDVETLDEAAPPVDGVDAAPAADELDTAEDIELLDQGPPAGTQVDDVELLDQGPTPAVAGESPAPSTVAAAPVTTDVAPVATSGPVLPEGFGTGDVHVATGSAGFPVGLNDCHVGAVTGRAYVGVDCSEGGESSFVGHAPSFEEFPFVLDESFPFGEGSVFAGRGTSPLEEEVQALIATAHGARSNDDEAAPEIRTSGASSVELAQRARDRKPRVEAENGRSKRGKEARRGGNANVTAVAQDADATSVETKQKKQKRGKDSNRGGSVKNEEKKSKSAKQSKKHGGKKGKKDRASV
jgi:hypothetical protein